MKKILCSILTLCIVLSGCQSTPKSDETIITPQPAPQFVTADTVTDNETVDEQIPKYIRTQVVDGITYKSVSDPLGYDFDILQVSADGEKSLLKDKEFYGRQLIDWKICDGKILFKTNIWLYCYNLADGTTDLILSDVCSFDYYNGYIYYREHASRTFTVYRTKIGSEDKQVVLGHDVYDKENPKELVSNFVITDDGEIVFTQRVPYGLYVYKNGKTKLILESKDINERSICCDKNDVYFVMQDSLYVYTQGKIKQLFELEDYKCNLYVQNGKLTYVSVNDEIIDKCLS